jgi:hypothetical protein
LAWPNREDVVVEEEGAVVEVEVVEVEVVVVVGGGGPDETISVTEELGPTADPAPGSDEMTMPAWYCDDGCEVVPLTPNPRLPKTFPAAA